MTDLLLSSVQNVLKTMICWFLMAKVSLEVESRHKSGSKTVLLTLLVTMMIIVTTTALPVKEEIYNNDYKKVIDFSSKRV